MPVQVQRLSSKSLIYKSNKLAIKLARIRSKWTFAERKPYRIIGIFKYFLKINTLYITLNKSK